jgi:signal peptidase II
VPAPSSPLLGALAAVFAADQAVKTVVLSRVAAPARSGLVAVRARLTRRTVAGRLGVPAAALIAVWLACLVAGVLLAPRAGLFDSPLAQAALGLALGGAAGNLADQVVRRGVVDYLAIGRWPAFNLADVAIVSGVIVALIAR